MPKVMPRFLPVESACRLLECTEAELKRFIAEGSLDVVIEIEYPGAWFAPLPAEFFAQGGALRELRPHAAGGWIDYALRAASGEEHLVETRALCLSGPFRLEGAREAHELRAAGVTEAGLLAPVDAEHARQLRESRPEAFPWADFLLAAVESGKPLPVAWADILIDSVQVARLLDGSAPPPRLGRTELRPRGGRAASAEKYREITALYLTALYKVAGLEHGDKAAYPKRALQEPFQQVAALIGDLEAQEAFAVDGEVFVRERLRGVRWNGRGNNRVPAAYVPQMADFLVKGGRGRQA